MCKQKHESGERIDSTVIGLGSSSTVDVPAANIDSANKIAKVLTYLKSHLTAIGIIAIVLLLVAGIMARNGWTPNTDPLTGKRTGWFSAALPTDAASSWNPFSAPLPLAPALFFRSVSSGDWNSTSTWESSTDNSTWVPAASTPTSTANTITVRSPDVVTVASNVNIVDTTVDVGAQLIINSGVTLTVDLATTGLTVNGTLTTGTASGPGLISGAGPFVLNSGANLWIGDANGITTAACGLQPNCGSVRTNSRTFSGGANYIYNGTTNQAVGDGLPSSVPNLVVSNTGTGGNNTVTGNVAVQTVSTLLNVSSGIFAPQAATTLKDVQIGGSGTLAPAASTNTNLTGTWTNNGAFTANSGTVNFNGTTAQSIGGSSTTSFANLTDSNTTSAVTFNTNFNVSGTFNMNGAGTLFTPGSPTVQINSAGNVGTITGTGRVQVTRMSANPFSGQYRFFTFSVTALTVEWAGAGDQSIENGVPGYGGIIASGGGTKTIGGGGTLAVNGNVAIGVGTTLAQGANTLNVSGNWNNGGGFTPGISPVGVTFNGSGSQIITTGGSGAGKSFDLFTINKSGGTATLAGPLRASTLNVAAGTLDTSAASSYAVTSTGDLNINGGTFNANASAIGVGGNWSNTGTFTAGTSSVTFNGATGQTVDGNTTFYTLTKSVAAAQQMNFTAGSTTTVTNSLTLTGAAANLLSLRSTTPGTQWNLVAPATQSVSYVNVRDSNAGGGSTVTATNSLDSTNNTNWSFGPSLVSIAVTPANILLAPSGTQQYTATGTFSDGSSRALVNGPATWTNKAGMAVSGRTNFAAATLLGQVYAIGGAQSAAALSSVEAYDPGTNSWATKASLPATRTAASAATVGTTMYALGGMGPGVCGAGLDGANLAYDPSTDAWTARAVMPTPRAAVGAVVINGLIYAAGGYNIVSCGSNGLPNLEVYDPVANSWTAKAAMPLTRLYHATATTGGKIYVIGGYTIPVAARNDVQIYDPGTDSWSAGAPMPTARGDLSAVAVNGKIYAIGGYDGGSVVSTVEVYDPVANTWSAGPNMINPRTATQTTAVDGTAYALGGCPPAFCYPSVTTNDALALGEVSWSSNNGSTATINMTGFATAVANGITTITATSGTISGNTGLTVGSPTAADASLGGRVVTADGSGITNAAVVVTGNRLSQPIRALTGPFGYYRFDGLEAGETYIVTVNSKRFTFQAPSRVITLSDNVADADFTANPLP